ncbi:MAG: transcriptional activator NhaR, partial [Bdellovibrionales bacterium]|nr:transcriptional activator NhaR [Bdellovibrionales bacterium]
MEWLNYQHLYYFWMTAREGTVVAAAERLRLAQPTISAQLRALEVSLEQKLFERVGRYLKLTEAGEVVFSYADEIFSLGTEMLNVIKERTTETTIKLQVGIADILPKLIVSSLLRPAIELPERIKIVAYDGKPNELLAKLSIHGLDLVLTDTPISPEVHVRAYNHLLGESEIALYAAPELAKKYRRSFPTSLQGAPMLLPTKTTTLRRSLDQWFDANAIAPDIVGEYEDSALLKIFAHQGCGIVPLPVVIEKEARRQYAITRVGTLSEVRERFYAISLERKIQHPGVRAITSS